MAPEAIYLNYELAFMEKHAVIIGDGTMATALAATVARNGHEAVLWSQDSTLVASINHSHQHTRHFPSYILPSKLTATTELAEAVPGAAILIMAVKSENVRLVALDLFPHLTHDACVLSATKGVDVSTKRFMSRVISDALQTRRIGIISGPNITIDIMNEAPTAILIAAEDQTVIDAGRQCLESMSLKVFGSTDLTGVEALSVIKNIVAIAAGLAINLGDNARSYIVSLGLAEIQALARALGARPESSGGLADIGEVFLSSTSKHSRNHMIGVDIANGAKLPDLLSALDALNETAEGVNAVQVSRDLARSAGISMPLAECVYEILFDNKPAGETLREFLSDKKAAKWLSSAAA
ncbi:NAD(P)H-dependent glycerol-3-phosphate dehydrogenase [Rhizobium laguerreae]|uniref:NAD(P)H-dependent glycerol-3-phosphate dehydrogenase n=1 Tax=Rhizobium laguerreae TaxID=1076926 RepID=UPI001C91DD4B|nr:NAD(P)H-dependent glycerol-3-phosphate dehydrogenase [Rhizobium laguerreae]MBY3095660.1 NAD(P)H-dependent glycerol-3-phosphate dehydrogenase [Rhizobium laguerreae]